MATTVYKLDSEEKQKILDKEFNAFDLVFNEKSITGYSHGEIVFETSKDFSNFKKIIITIVATGDGQVTADTYQYLQNVFGIVVDVRGNQYQFQPIHLASTDKVEFTIEPQINYKEHGYKRFEGYNVVVNSTADIGDIKLKCIPYEYGDEGWEDDSNISEEVILNVPVRELDNYGMKVFFIKICDHCGNETCRCGAESWIMKQIPVSRLE